MASYDYSDTIWVPLSEDHFILAALINATDARHLINAFIYYYYLFIIIIY